MSPAGRPRGSTGHREAILAAARQRFAEHGYERTSLRAIAADVGVDAALIHHYYGTKDELLTAAIRLPVAPEPILAAAFATPERVGEVVARSVLSLWERVEVRDRLTALLRAAFTHPGAATVLHGVLTRDLLGPAASRITLDRAELRTALVGSQLVGLAVTRYLLELGPIAATSTEELVAAIAPTLQRYLSDPGLFG